MVVAHPYWDASFSNKNIVEAFKALHPEAVISNISELYPDGIIDVAAEQDKLLKADTIILQYPMMWYSCPSLMHRWMEEVLAFGFAYGPGGDKLKGKRVIPSFTSASSNDMYSIYSAQKMNIDQLMAPLATTIPFCSMIFPGYIYTGGMMLPYNADEKVKDYLRNKAEDHARRLSFVVGKVGK